MAVLATVMCMLIRAPLFAGSFIPIAPNQGGGDGGALVGPINDGDSIALTGAGKDFFQNTDRTTATSVGSNNRDAMIAVVPEPATWGMMLLGGGLLAAMRRFRRK